MIDEKKFLLDILDEAGYTVMLRRFYMVNHRPERTKVEYISPNSGIIGSKANVILEGLRLPEDFIHPEDRQKLAESSIQARMTGEKVKNTIRMIADDTKLITVEFTSVFVEGDENEQLFEYIIKERPEPQTQTIPEILESEAAEPQDVDSFLSENKVLTIAQTITFFENLYSTFVTLDGKNLVRPVGPETYLGIFYDMFERPMYKELYGRILASFETSQTPFVSEMDDNMEGSYVSAAPIYMNGELVATWLICSYEKETSAKIGRISQNQWNIAKCISEYLDGIYANDGRTTRLSEIEKKLEAELSQKKVITTTLDEMRTDIDSAISNMMKDAGELLSIDSVAYYVADPGDAEAFILKDYWDVNSDEPDEFIMNEIWGIKKYVEKTSDERGLDGYIIDHESLTNQVRVEVFQGRARALLLYPVSMGSTIMGWLAFVNRKEERVWTEQEIGFTKELTRITARGLRKTIGEDSIKKTNQMLLETYNHVRACIFIKEDKTGTVLFSNDTLNKLLGYDFVGKDSRRLIQDLHDKFEDVKGMRKSGLDTGNVTHWRRYINAFDGIYDITQLKMNWDGNVPASCVILRIARD